MYVEIPFVQVLVLGLVFDSLLLAGVITHVRYVSRLNGQITALEASTDMLLMSQGQLAVLIGQLVSKSS